MRISIKMESDIEEDMLELNNEDLDTLNYINLTIGKESFSLDVDELQSALVAFISYRDSFNKWEQN